MLNQPFIKELLTALFYFFVIFNIIIRIIVTKKRKKKKKKKKKKNLKGGTIFTWKLDAEAGGGLYKIFRDFFYIIWCIITFGQGEGCFQDKEVESVEEQLRRQGADEDFGIIFTEFDI